MMKELDECFFMVLLLHRLQLLWLNARPEWLLKILKRPDESDLAPCMSINMLREAEYRSVAVHGTFTLKVKIMENDGIFPLHTMTPQV
ncbi:hypothetical protein SCA6_005511 [Theobroma cacao]